MVILNIEKHSITSRGYAVIYNQTLEEVMWLLRLQETKRQKISKNLIKLQDALKNC